MQKNLLTEAEIRLIEKLVNEGKTIEEIAQITGRSTQSVIRVRSRMDLAPVSKSEQGEVARMLREAGWPPKVTDKCKCVVVKEKKRKSNFRTPYNTR